jgi:hypothetical protein
VEILRSKLFLISLTVLFQATSISFGNGDLLLDQANTFELDAGAFLFKDHWVWQEFRPTMNNLEQVDFFFDAWSAPDGEVVTFELRDNNDTTSWSTSFSSDVLPSWGWFVLDTPHIPLVPEATYLLYLTSSTPYNDYGAMPNWCGTIGDLYTRGDGWWPYPEEKIDYNFRTWAIPEPAAVLLFGLGGLALLRKRMV